jgi:hypothetical protein
MLIGGIFLVVFIGVIVWLVVSAQDRAEQLELEQTTLDTYTDGLSPVVESVIPTATDMIAITTLPEGDALDSLAEDATTWVTDLQTAQALVQQQFAPEEAQSVNDLLTESIGLYISAAQTFELVPDAEGGLRDKLFTRATDQRDAAGRVMSGAIGALDSVRNEKDLGASGLRSPADLPPPAPSAPASPEADASPEVGESPEGSGGGGDQGDGAGDSQKDGKKKDGNDGDANDG